MHAKIGIATKAFIYLNYSNSSQLELISFKPIENQTILPGKDNKKSWFKVYTGCIKEK